MAKMFIKRLIALSTRRAENTILWWCKILAKAIMMNSKDNVATLLTDVEAGHIIAVSSTSGEVVREVKAKKSIPFGHKIAIRKIERNGKILKYGEVIGEALEAIQEGEHVHLHNVRSLTWRRFL